MADLAAPGRLMPGGNLLPGDPLQGSEEFVHRDLPLAGDVEHLAGNAGFFHGQEVRPDDIFDVGEIASLEPVAVDDRPLSPEEGQDELGHDRGINGLRVLARPEDIEIPEGNGLQLVQAGKNLSVHLSGVFGGGIRGFRVGGEGSLLSGRLSSGSEETLPYTEEEEA